MAANHPYADRYSFAKVWSEGRIVREREGRQTALELVGIQAAIISVVAGKTDHLAEIIKSLNNGD